MCALEQAVCQCLTPVAELGVWPPNIIGQQTGEGEIYCSVFFSAEGRENMLRHCWSCRQRSLYVHHPFPSSTSKISSSLLPYFPCFFSRVSPSFLKYQCKVKLTKTSITTAPLLFRNPCSSFCFSHLSCTLHYVRQLQYTAVRPQLTPLAT